MSKPIEAFGDLFSVEFYSALCGIPFEDPQTAVDHYCNQGWLIGLDPSPKFSTEQYIARYPDVAASKQNPLIHYIVHGRSEGRIISPSRATDVSVNTKTTIRHPEAFQHFDPEYYLTNSPDLQGATIDPWEHFLDYGWREHRNPNAQFRVSEYLDQNPAVAASGKNPFLHWIELGSPDISPERTSDQNQHRENIENFGLSDSDIAQVHSAFDIDFYRQNNSDLSGSDSELFSHYMLHGWKEHRNPSPTFSTSYYLENNPDIRDANVNPFAHYVLHGHRESRVALPFSATKRNLKESPLITAIVPNYNHAKFLTERLASITNQTYKNIEVIILDDVSTDNSREVIEGLIAKSNTSIKKIFNKKNSGGVFYQWQRGIKAAKGELIWICESDDICEPDFVSHLVHYFSDPSVMIAFGAVQFCDAKGRRYEGLDGYRESAEQGIWNEECVRPAAEWFRNAFAISNIIPNVGGCIFRKQNLPQEVWDRAVKYRISADWYLYMVLAAGGRIAYNAKAIAYFRQHGKNTSVTGFVRPEYYKEHELVALEMRRRWSPSAATIARLYSNVVSQYEYVGASNHVGEIDTLISLPKILRQKRESRHILIAFLGFHLGGGELFPINLANALHGRGYIVSMLAFDGNEINRSIKCQLNPSIAVYEAQLVKEIGVDRFIENAGVDLIHSHAVALEFFFFHSNRLTKKVPYLVSLHGSYEVTPIPDDVMFRIISGVDHWFYLADKNLAHLKAVPLDPTRITQVVNGMPEDDREFTQSRESLAIAEGSFIFGIASRAIRPKGWLSAARALQIAKGITGRKLTLLLCGEGPDFNELNEELRGIEDVLLLGFQDRIHGFYRMIDCAMLPSRFRGESYPLALIQAMQVGIPIISTNVGEIPTMLIQDEKAAGLVVDPIDDDDDFAAALADAMIRILDNETYTELSRVSADFGRKYSLESVATGYIEYYESYMPR